MLIGQAYDPVTFFAGQPKVYSVVEGKYVAGAEFTLPRDLGLYGWTYANLGDRQPLLVALDDDDHLIVYSGLTMVWKSAEEYTSAGFFVYKPVTGIDAMLSRQATALDKSQRVKIRGRVVAGDMNNDGREEIVIQKNHRFEHARRIHRGRAQRPGLDRRAARAGVERQGHKRAGVRYCGSSPRPPERRGSLPW